MHSRFESAFAQLPAALQDVLAPWLNDDHFPAMLSASQVEAVKRHSGLDDEALAFALLPLAAACAQTDISHFNVGAIARGLSGALYFGANMEFTGVAMQQTVHAEQSAITHAWMRGEKGLSAITVNYTPCGHCRQFMNELNSGLTLRINLPGRAPSKLGDYLPDAFGPRDLDIKTLIFDAEDHAFALKGETFADAAIKAASRSHAPYSQSPSGIALQTADGQIFTGSYAENAAFNPSLPPLQAALNLLSLNGYGWRDIQRAALAEKTQANIVQWDATVATLRAVGCHAVEHIALD
ncbi:cytidine deaminase [Franconibacter helveticus]|uniref:cytidine deaminase n=1 Tax=Franconibacter helveticus TaxID=357240 RepID=UPI000DA1E467|nr:cytidine deaminase [Franconibacter helveticus]